LLEAHETTSGKGNKTVMKLIGFCGPAKAGKTSVAKYFRRRTLQHVNSDSAQARGFSFAQSLKEYCVPIINKRGKKGFTHPDGRVYLKQVTAMMLNLQEIKELRFCDGERETIRELLIEQGMGKREDDPEYWIKKTFEAIDHYIHHSPINQACLITICDVRFDNEAQAILDYGGSLIEVINHQCSYDMDNPSERGIDRTFLESALQIRTCFTSGSPFWELISPENFRGYEIPFLDTGRSYTFSPQDFETSFDYSDFYHEKPPVYFPEDWKR
jgi:hypothetical protein